MATGRRFDPAAARWPWGLTGLALAVRLALLVADPAAPFARYPLAAGRLLAGQMPVDRLLDLSLVYLGLHAAARFVAGEHGAQVVLVLHALGGAATALAIAPLGRRLVGAGAGLLARLPGRAVAELTWVVDVLPELRRAQLLPAAALSRQDRSDAAIRHHAAGMRIAGDVVILEDDVRRLADGLAAAHPDDSEALALRDALRRQVDGPAVTTVGEEVR